MLPSEQHVREAKRRVRKKETVHQRLKRFRGDGGMGNGRNGDGGRRAKRGDFRRSYYDPGYSDQVKA